MAVGLRNCASWPTFPCALLIFLTTVSSAMYTCVYRLANFQEVSTYYSQTGIRFKTTCSNWETAYGMVRNDVKKNSLSTRDLASCCKPICDHWACVERSSSVTTEKEAGNSNVESYTPWCRQDRGLNLIRSNTSTWLGYGIQLSVFICWECLCKAESRRLFWRPLKTIFFQANVLNCKEQTDIRPMPKPRKTPKSLLRVRV